MHNFNISGLQTIKVSFFILLFVFVPPFLSPLGLPVVSPQGGDPNATSRGERFAPTRARVGGKRKRAAFSPGWFMNPSELSQDIRIVPKQEAKHPVLV